MTYCRALRAVGLLFLASSAQATGVSPYLPLNLSPLFERQIERILILAGKPVSSRPIAAAAVLDALPEACKIDAPLCRSVGRYLERLMRDSALTDLRLTAAATEGGDPSMANAHGQSGDAAFQLSGEGFYQPSDHLLINLGGILSPNGLDPTGTYLSVGSSFAQVDIGFRDHWFSPMSDSSMLISTQAKTMPSVTISNYVPFSFLGASYEVFLAQMSSQKDIRFFDSVTEGYPRLAGVQLAAEPVAGFSFSLNRVMQFGGGARGGGSFGDLRDAFLVNQNRPDSAGTSQEFGNQAASVTASAIFPGRRPVKFSMEYAGEDNSYGGNYRLGDTALSLGIAIPRWWRGIDLNYELTEFQNVWYTHHIYPEGLSNDGHVIGHWFGDMRRPGDTKGGRAQTLSIGVPVDSGYWLTSYRTLGLVNSVGYQVEPAFDYRHLHELSVGYTTDWLHRELNGTVTIGRDVDGGYYARLAATVGWLPAFILEKDVSTDDSEESVSDWFVDLGMNRSGVTRIFSLQQPYDVRPVTAGLHVGFGVRRPVSDHQDLGLRMELDQVDGFHLVTIRALDYRYRFAKSLALSAFLGVGRYDWRAPAYGWNLGAGAQWRNIVRGWDLGFDWRYYDKLSRNRVIEGDPPFDLQRPRLHFDIKSQALYLTRHF